MESSADAPLLFASRRFEKSLAAISPAVSNAAFQEVQTLLRRYASDRRTFLHSYDRVEHLKPAVVIELELGGGPRLLAHFEDGVLALLDVGTHDVVQRYDRRWLREDINGANVADDAFLPDSGAVEDYFPRTPELRSVEFGRELHPDWVYYLTDQQQSVVATVLRHWPRSQINRPYAYFVVGGPGTGKTSILTKLLLELSRAGARPALSVSDGVARYIEAGAGISLHVHRVDAGVTASQLDGQLAEFDVLLVDDPSGAAQVESALHGSIGRVRTVVVAFDPLQLEDDLTDAAYERLRSAYEVKAYELKSSYRQKENLGRVTKKIVDQLALGTPYTKERRIEEFRGNHQLIYRLSNDIRFPNPLGYVEVHWDAGPDAALDEIRRIAGTVRWQHVPSTLVVLEGRAAKRWPWSEWLKLADISADVVDVPVSYNRGHALSALQAIKGLEFQHALIAISESLYREIQQSFNGSGDTGYHASRFLRIPFSRGKDSMSIFVTVDREAPQGDPRNFDRETLIRRLHEPKAKPPKVEHKPRGWQLG